MSARELELIKDRQLFLKNGECSSEVVLVDANGEGDMYFAFNLNYVKEAEKPQTHIQIVDSHHATLAIDIVPGTVTKPVSPVRIGTYGAEKRNLYISFVVEPQMTASGEHPVNISFYVGKEVKDADS